MPLISEIPPASGGGSQTEVTDGSVTVSASTIQLPAGSLSDGGGGTAVYSGGGTISASLTISGAHLTTHSEPADVSSLEAIRVEGTAATLARVQVVRYGTTDDSEAAKVIATLGEFNGSAASGLATLTTGAETAQTANVFEAYDEDFNNVTVSIGPAGVLTVVAGGVIFPSADPHVVGAWWDNGVTLVRSAG